MSDQNTTFKIHPALGIARLGTTDDDFYLTPEQPGTLPIECDEMGTELFDSKGQPIRVTNFKDQSDLSKIRKQAARFRIFAYDGDEDKAGKEIEIGGQYDFVYQNPGSTTITVKGTVTDVSWTVHLANKKSSWYEFQQNDGTTGYEPTHPLRNPTVTEPDQRRQLITDPGPVTVNSTQNKGSFAKFGSASDPSGGKRVSYPQTFPPETTKPHTIESLGSLIANTNENKARLIVLGGYGKSGSTNTPVIESYANNDGWFDDISDGPVTATISFYFLRDVYDGDKKKKKPEKIHGTMDVQVPAWVVVGYPRYVPEMEDMITLDENLYDIFVRNMAYDPQVFGVAPFSEEANSPDTTEQWHVWKTEAKYNEDYYPKFFEEIWPILRRPDDYMFTYDFDDFDGGGPHNRGTGGNLSKDALSKPPKDGQDPYQRMRQFVYNIMRKRDQLNEYQTNEIESGFTSNKPRLMPLLAGNNPISNTAPEKFLAMTETQLFFLKQWAEGKFVNECEEWKDGEKNCDNPWSKPPTTGVGIDRGVLSNLLGGAFCPGGEVAWIINNPAIYDSPYRIRHAPYLAGALSLPAVIDGGSPADLSAGLEPGDLTKYIGIPWQADFHECTYQNINITYKEWNQTYPESTGDPTQQLIAYNIPWWPAHRPIVITSPNGGQYYWASGIPANNAGDLQMVQAWKDLGFLKYLPDTPNGPGFYMQERNESALGPLVAPGDRILGQTNTATTKKDRKKS